MALDNVNSIFSVGVEGADNLVSFFGSTEEHLDTITTIQRDVPPIVETLAPTAQEVTYAQQRYKQLQTSYEAQLEVIQAIRQEMASTQDAGQFKELLAATEEAEKGLRQVNEEMETLADFLPKINEDVQGTMGFLDELGDVDLSGALAGDTSDLDATVRIYQQLQGAHQKQLRTLQDIRREMRGVTDPKLFQQMVVEAERVEDQLMDIEQAMERVSRQGGRGLGGGFGGGAALQQLGGYTSSFGMMGASGTLSQFGDVSQIFSDLGQSASEMGGKFGRLAGPFNQVARLAGPIGAVVAGVQVGADLFDKVFRGFDAEAARERIDSMREEADLDMELTQLIREGSVESIEQMIQSQEDLIASHTELRDQNIANAQQNTSTIDMYKTLIANADEAREHTGWLGKAILTAVDPIGDAAQAVGLLGDYSGQATDEILDLNRELDAAPQKVDKMRQALEQAAQRQREIQAAERVKEAEENLAQIREREIDIIRNYERQVADYLEDETRSRSRELEDQQRQDARAMELFQRDLARMEEEGNQRIIDLRAEQLEELANMEREYAREVADARAQLLEDLADVDAQLVEDQADLLEQYNESRADSLEQFLRDSEQAEEDYERARLQRLEDLHNSLRDAEMANDVVAFINAQNAAQDDLDRIDEDFQNAQQEREEQFQLEQQQAQEQFQEEMANLQQQAAERRDELQQQYEEERAERAQEFAESLAQYREEATQRLAEERAALDESLSQAQQAFAEQRALEQEERDLAEERRQEDQELRLQEMQEAFDEEMEQLNTERNEQLQVIEDGGQDRVDTMEQEQNLLTSTMQTGANNRLAIMQGIEQQMTLSTQNMANSMSQAMQAAQQAAQQTVQSQFFGGGGSGGGGSSSLTSSNNIAAINSGLGWNALGSGNINLPVGQTITGQNVTMGAIIAMQRGGIVDEPTLALLGEGDRPEAVVPLSQSGGLPSNMPPGGDTFEFFFENISVGDGISEGQVRTVLQDMGMTIVQAISDARAGASMNG